MKRRSSHHHPDQLTLSLNFIRRIICSAAEAKSPQNDGTTRFKSRKKTGAESHHNDGAGSAPVKKESFAQTLVRERKRHGFTQTDAAQILQIGTATLERWETEKITPKPATQLGAIAALRTSKISPGKAKLEEVKQAHHLDWEQGKGWRLRVTVDVGKKVVGKRLSLRLGTYVLEEAMQRKRVILALLTKLGLTVRQRVQKRSAK